MHRAVTATRQYNLESPPQYENRIMAWVYLRSITCSTRYHWIGSYVNLRGSRPVLRRNPIFFVIFRGEGGSDPLSPLWIRTWCWKSHVAAHLVHLKPLVLDVLGIGQLLTINAPITTKVVCFSRLLKCLRSLCGKQFGPRSDCSYMIRLLL